MKLIVLHNKANCGKSTVLKFLYGMFVNDFSYKQTYYKAEEKDDISAKFMKNGKTIALTSVGDNETVLKNAFDGLNATECDIVISACRSRDTKNGAVAFIKDLGVKDIIWYTKAYIGPYNNHYDCTPEFEVINKAQARMLFNEVESLL